MFPLIAEILHAWVYDAGLIICVKSFFFFTT